MHTYTHTYKYIQIQIQTYTEREADRCRQIQRDVQTDGLKLKSTNKR